MVMGMMSKTPLQMALEKKNRCNDTTAINGVLYCNKSGKIILE